MSPQLLSAGLGLLISVLTLSQVAPSVQNVFTSQNIELGISRESALVQQILQYRNIEGAFPATVADLVAKDYWKSSENNNGLGGTYTFVIDQTRATITVSSTISDADKRARYIGNKKHVFKPVDVGSGVVSVRFALPTVGLAALPLPASGNVTASAVAPNASSNSYWYDTSGASAVLKISDGSQWIASRNVENTVQTSAIPAPTASSVVASAAALPASGAVGDVRYVFNNTTKMLDTVVYDNGAWRNLYTAANGKTSADKALVISPAVFPIGRQGVAFSSNLNFTNSIVLKSSDPTNTSTYVKDPAKLVTQLSSSLPAGLTINSTGLVAGTPTAQTTAAGTSVNIFAQYDTATAYQSYNLKILPAYLKLSKLGAGNSFGYHSCAVTTGGGVKCWGKNTSGQLGNGTTLSSYSPVDVVGLTSGVSSVSTGSGHSCAILTTGAVKCWGDYPGLGNGAVANSSTPVQVTGLTSGVTALTSGDRFTCAIAAGASLKCWGGNFNGNLGNNSKVDALTPVQVTGLTSGVLSVAAGGSHVCAVVTPAAVKCWGDNSSGQYGNNSITASTVPVAAGTGVSAASVTSGASYTCAITTANGVKCWGQNYANQLGNGTYTDSLVPVTTLADGTGITMLSLGAEQSCAITAAGVLRCWGYGYNGELGNGSYSELPTPTIIAGVSASWVSAGVFFTCIIDKSTTNPKCFGDNADGKLGVPLSTANSAVPLNIENTW